MITNAGKAPHELAMLPLGDTEKSHAILTVGRDKLSSGATVTIVHSFSEQLATGEYEFACHVGRHYEEGMMLKISIK